MVGVGFTPPTVLKYTVHERGFFFLYFKTIFLLFCFVCIPMKCSLGGGGFDFPPEENWCLLRPPMNGEAFLHFSTSLFFVLFQFQQISSKSICQKKRQHFF